MIMRRLGAASPVEIVIAVSTGCARISGAIGLPLVHVDAADDADAHVRRLNEATHGSAVVRRGPGDPFRLESGWDDWGLFRLEPEDSSPPCPEVCVHDGRIVAMLPPGTTLNEFREQLRAALRHLRLQEASLAAARAIPAQAPRYTPASRRPPAASIGVRDAATPCDDIYVLDPAELGWRLLWIVVAARLAAMEGARPLWR